MSLSTDIIEIENTEILNQILNQCDEVMGHNPFSRSDFKRAVDQILADTLGRDYMSRPINIDKYEIVADVVDWLSDYMGEY